MLFLKVQLTQHVSVASLSCDQLHQMTLAPKPVSGSKRVFTRHMCAPAAKSHRNTTVRGSLKH